MSSPKKIDLSRTRAFAVRVIDAFMLNLLTENPDFIFPARTTAVEADETGAGENAPRQITVFTRSMHGHNVRLFLQVAQVGSSVICSFSGQGIIAHQVDTSWSGSASEDKTGRLSFGPIVRNNTSRVPIVDEGPEYTTTQPGPGPYQAD